MEDTNIVKEKFITEEFPTEITLVEEETDGSVYIEGIFLKGNIVSRNNRFYAEQLVKSFVEQINSNKSIITMWTNHWPSDETLATVARVIEAKYDESTKLAWFKAKMGRSTAAKDVTSLLQDKILEGVSVRYYPVKVKEAQIKDAIYISILEAELFGIDFVATRAGVPVAKVKSVSKEELETFETAFNREGELEMVADELNKDNVASVEATPDEAKVEDVKVEDTKVEDTKPEESDIKETNTEEPKAEEVKPEEPKAEDIKPEEVKVEGIESDESEGELIDYKGKYESLVARITKYCEEQAKGIREEAILSFETFKDKKIYGKILAEIEALTLTFSEDFTESLKSFSETVESIVASYKDLLEELAVPVSTTEAKEDVLVKGERIEGKELKVNNVISEETVNMFSDYGISLTEEDIKFMEGK